MSMYGTSSEADDYFENIRLFSDEWFLENQSNRSKALLQATRIIESLNFVGAKTDSEQDLEFPRGGDTEIPVEIEYAAYEIAFALLDGRDVEMEAEQFGEEAANFGQGSVRVNPDLIHISKIHGVPSVVAWQYLRPYLQPGDEIILSRVS